MKGVLNSCKQMDSLDFIKWGYIRHLLIVSALPIVDELARRQFGEVADKAS